MTTPLGLHATSDVHGGCAQSVSFADSPSHGLVRRTERSQRIGEKERRIRATVRDENGRGRETNRTRKNARLENKNRDKETCRGEKRGV